MTDTREKGSLLKDRLLRTGLVSTAVAFLACLSTHILAIAGVTGAIALAGTVEHALLFAVAAFAALTIYAAIRHRRSARRATASGRQDRTP